MTKKYQELFSINLLHHFYSNGQAQDLSLNPDAETQQVLRMYDLIWRKGSEGQYALFFGAESGKTVNLALLGDQSISLRFVLQNANPYFFNFTRLDIDKSNSHKLYFSNIDPFPGKGTDGIVLSKQASAGDDDLFPVVTSVFNFKSPDSAILSVRDGSGAVLPTENSDTPSAYWALSAGNEADVFQVDLRDFPPGKFAVETAPDKLHWFYVDGTNALVGKHGIIELHVGNSNEQMIPLPSPDADTTYPASRFSIQFETRATRWRYFLIQNSKIEFDRMEIVDGDNPMAFKIADEPKPLPGSTQTAVSIVLENALPLQERPRIKPKLKLISSQEDPILIDLPVPDHRQIRPEGVAGDRQFYSDMYIYL